ncbi:hypothetical protein KKG46_05465 [Patescibacteria group bacterium]|nr:hypothetical protein [Patescibacteria group bacterium]
MPKFENVDKKEKSKSENSRTLLEKLRGSLSKKTIAAVIGALTASGAVMERAGAFSSNDSQPTWVDDALQGQINIVKTASDELKQAISLPLEIVSFPLELAKETRSQPIENNSVEMDDDQLKKPKLEYNVADWYEPQGGDPFSEQYKQREREITNKKEQFINQTAAEVSEVVFENLHKSDSTNTNKTISLEHEAQQRCKFINNESGRQDCTTKIINTAKKNLDEKLLALATEDPDSAYQTASNISYDGKAQPLDVALRSNNPSLFIDWVGKQGVSSEYIHEAENYKIEALFSSEDRLNDLTGVFPDLPQPYQQYIYRALEDKVNNLSNKIPDSSTPQPGETSKTMREMEKYQMYLDAISGYEPNE